MKFLTDKLHKEFAGDPLVELHPISKGELRIRANNLDERQGPRYFRIKIIEEMR